MKLKNCLFVLFFLIVNQSYAEVGYDRIFVVDVSASMKKDNLHVKVKETLINYINKCRQDDRIILMTFGTNVNPGIEDKLLHSNTINKDKIEIVNYIKTLNFNDDWTWMSKAFDIIGSRLYDLQLAYPERPKRVYVFTDGLNDPPPDKKDTLTFDDVLSHHFDEYEKEDTYVYVIFLGVQPDKSLKPFLDKINAKPVLRERDEEILIKEISLEPTKIERNMYFSKNILINFDFEVIKMENVEKQNINLKLKDNNFSKEANISHKPSTFSCNSYGQKIPIAIEIENIDKADKYKLIYDLKPEDKAVIIDPKQLDIYINIKNIIVKVRPNNINISCNIKEDRKEFILEFENDTFIDNIPVELSITLVDKNKQLDLNPRNINISKGTSREKFTIFYNGFSQGKYKCNVIISSTNDNLKIEPNNILLNLSFFKPAGPIRVIILLIILFLLLVGLLRIIKVNIAFSKWYISAEGLSPMPLNSYKKFYSNKLTVGKDVYPELQAELVIIYSNFQTIFNNKLFVKPLIISDEIYYSVNFEENIIKELENFNIEYQNYKIYIRKGAI